MISYSTIIIASALGVVPVIAWMWLVVRYHRQHERGVMFLMNLFLLGVMTAVPASIFELVLQETQGLGVILSAMQQVWAFQPVPNVMAALVSAGLVAAIEEISKAAAILVAVFSKKFKIHNDGLVYGALVGLAFAVTENGVYFASALHSEPLANVSSVIILRFLLSTTAHMVYSGLLGKFLADARLADTPKQKALGYLKALLIPITVHLAFNWLLSTPASLLIVPLLFVGMFILWRSFNQHSAERDPEEGAVETVY